MTRLAVIGCFGLALWSAAALAKPKYGPSEGTEAARPAASEQPAAVPLKADVAAAGVLDLEGNGLALYRIEVPADAVQMTVQIFDCPLILDLMARYDEPLSGPDDAEHRSMPDVLDSALRISRQSLPALESGDWWIGVAYLDGAPPIVHRRPVKQIPFSIKVSFVRAQVAAELAPGKTVRGQVRIDRGSVSSYAIDVPEGAKALRFDLDEVSSNLDILARRDEPLVANDDADAAAISPLGRETLLVDASSPTPLTPGRWYVNVVHPACFGVVDFTLYASFDAEPPRALLAIPPLECPSDPRARAVRAAVDVSTEVAGASGTLITPDGLTLTNYHVVAEVAEGAQEKNPVIIGATVDARLQPRELFRGRVLVFNKELDLALVEITSGLYGQPLPRGYRFPTVPLGDAAKLEIGDAIAVIGFPSIGGASGRVSVTLTQGVLSGFEQMPIGTLLKTDAAISPGSSGGAAFDRQWRLIGVPTFENISPEAVSRMSYVHPITMLPAAWRKMIAERMK